MLEKVSSRRTYAFHPILFAAATFLLLPLRARAQPTNDNNALTPFLPTLLPTTNLTLPPINFTAPAANTVGVTCAPPSGDSTHQTPVVVPDCIIALGLPRRESAENYLLNKYWATAGVPVEPGTVRLPAVWDHEGCYMVVNSMKTKEQGGDHAVFSLIGASYFASLVLVQCVVGEKITLGGRFLMSEGGIYVDVTGDLPKRPRGEGEGEGEMGFGNGTDATS